MTKYFKIIIAVLGICINLSNGTSAENLNLSPLQLTNVKAKPRKQSLLGKGELIAIHKLRHGKKLPTKGIRSRV